jgi:hypothetical protein
MRLLAAGAGGGRVQVGGRLPAAVGVGEGRGHTKDGGHGGRPAVIVIRAQYRRLPRKPVHPACLRILLLVVVVG